MFGGYTTESGGRKPAVGGQMRIGRHERHSSADRRRCVCGLPLHSRLLAPRGADGSRNWSDVRMRLPAALVFRRFVVSRTMAGHEGLTPPALGCSTIVRR
jgi:hypothetical protein